MVVIHEINFVSCYADHILAIKNGKIIQDSKSNDVIENEILKKIYGIDMNIKIIDDKKYCLYY